MSAALLALAAASGCADTGDISTDTGGGTTDAQVPDVVSNVDAPVVDAWLAPDGFQLGESVVYAHTESELYSVNPDTLKVSKVADFVWPGGAADKMTDIAIDAKGRVIGVSSKSVYAIDAKTGACTKLSTIDKHFVGLSFVKPDGGEAEFLIGIDKSAGEVYRIDPSTGATTLVGTFGNDWLASGDIVSVRGFGTMATLIKKNTKDPTDQLASINPYTGKATPIGDTGFKKIWGLGYWKGKLYGFTAQSEFVLIDVKTGKGTLQEQGKPIWWGAGVTTVAPTIN